MVDEKSHKSTVPLSVVKEKPAIKKRKNDLDDVFFSEVMKCLNDTNAYYKADDGVHSS